ncbi:MAG: response regulator transcription factor [Eubacterium sp.]|nr:response regulator transcription factor [Eubacterium sp.]
MIRVAICDDEPKTLQCLKEAVARYGKRKNLDLAVELFASARDLEAQIETRPFQIYILDMLMPQMNGIELGQSVRKADAQAVIIYLTSTMDFAYQAFGVFAQRYLLKPLKEPELYEAMDFAAANIHKLHMALNVNTSDGIQRVFYHEIEYVENAARALHIFATDGKEIVSRLLRRSFENDMECLLQSREFIQTHKSFIVNLNYVKLYSQGQITMRSGAQIPVSKSRQSETKRAYLQYISEHY